MQDLERHGAVHGQLLGQVDLAHAAFADAPDQLVAADLLLHQHAAFGFGPLVADDAGHGFGQPISGGRIHGAIGDQHIAQSLLAFPCPVHRRIELLRRDEPSLNGQLAIAEIFVEMRCFGHGLLAGELKVP